MITTFNSTDELARHIFKTYSLTNGFNPTNPSIAEIAVKDIESLINEHVKRAILSQAHREGMIRRAEQRHSEGRDLPAPIKAGAPVPTSVQGRDVTVTQVRVAPRRV